MKVYLVTSGEYSDYKVEAIFDDKELAKKFISLHGKHCCNDEIEEFEMNKYKSDTEKGLCGYGIWMERNGKYKIHSEILSHECQNKLSFTYNNEYLVVYCLAKSEEHAVKIANEKRTQILALDRWGINNPLGE